MTYEITIQDFLLIVKNPSCQGNEIENGKAEEGHASCSHCKGNYFVNGECNYGGSHKMVNDLKAINRNFRAFDVLVQRQAKISSSKSEQEFNQAKEKLLTAFQELKKKCEDESGTGFFYGSCVGLDADKNTFLERIKSTFRRLASELDHYIKQVKKSNWKQLKEFQEKLDQLDKMQSEATQLAKEWKDAEDRGDKKEAARLIALLRKKNQAIDSLQSALRKNPVYEIFSTEKSDELANIVKNIFQGDPNQSFFNWNKEKVEGEAKEAHSDKYFGLIPKESTNNLLLLLGGTLAIVFIYQYWKKFTN